ncbi:hypothetical protein [Paenibacillus spongiae]|uniref:Lipoprotein n=1 Tax=Paenibacillus spongiae TaxID=2909671 RepID=A0ABY5SBX7_9BACL|nr:hypothetical protein [Paenibacillus spongiae]UVI30267.1 hypothetical protein L1F29_33715 [Paenibacillus spongiae]
MRKRGIWIGGVVLLLVLAGCGNPAVEHSAKPPSAVGDHADEAVRGTETSGEQPDQTMEKTAEGETKPALVEYKRLENVFGFADESGEQLITIPDESGADLENPKQFSAAVGNNGDWVEIEFVRRQDANEQDNNRQTMYNFNNMSGYVYKAKKGKLIPNKSYLLTRDGVIGENAFIDLQSTVDGESQSGEYLPADAETIAQMEAMKKRKITASRLLSESAEERIALFVFEREADDMLASIAYIKGDRVLFKDFPAKYDEFSTWRVDGGDEPGRFEVLFLAHSDEGLLLGMSWGAPEGENLFVLKEADGAFQETGLRSGRYWAPQ